MDSREQWKDKGNCSKCRRLTYCGSECKAHKKLLEQDVTLWIACRMMRNMCYGSRKYK